MLSCDWLFVWQTWKELSLKDKKHPSCLPVELLLQPLICIVNAELLEAVLLEALKPIDIQNAQ